MVSFNNGETFGEGYGRRRIYSDAQKVDEENLISVLQLATAKHEQNVSDMRYLLNYEKGDQPLKRTKTVRSDIDIKVSDNVANQVVEFKLGYNWGNPIKFVQRGSIDISKSDTDMDDDSISRLNEMNDAEMAFAKDQELARYVEICGIGYQFVDIKREYIDGDSPFDLVTLNPMQAFKVYRNDIYQTELLDVTYSTDTKGCKHYTCFTKDRVYYVTSNMNVQGDIPETERGWFVNEGRSGDRNPLGAMPIVEFIRAYDRMGCFERQISDMDALNIEVSDFANSVAQDTQAIWWGNDFDFKADKKGNPIKPVGGQWVLTNTTAKGKTPLIRAISSAFNYSGVQQNIENKRNLILQKCYVPLQTDPGGGSTASAMSLSSGWSAAEANACKEEQIIKRSKLKVIQLELIAIRNGMNLASDDPIRKLKASAIDAKFTRLKTFDLGTKTNAMVTMIKSGINGRIAMQTVDLFPDISQAWSDSKQLIEKYQESLFNKPETEGDNTSVQDMMGQTGNSPILDGLSTQNNEVV